MLCGRPLSGPVGATRERGGAIRGGTGVEPDGHVVRSAQIVGRGEVVQRAVRARGVVVRHVARQHLLRFGQGLGIVPAPGAPSAGRIRSLL